ncbi:MAG TPA: adenylate/guanylate cyclase domain-containing protein, partial [Candidatus Limnocylindrales bacterium]|nr:adenylate/guanylate cyclase domain-containing protein [Candidatus Limnocylindrales bacterium]
MLDGGYGGPPAPAQRSRDEDPQPAWSGGAAPAPPAGPASAPVHGSVQGAGAAPAAFPGFDAPADPAPRSAAPLPSSEVRKIVTIIFSDLKGSTALTEKIDAEAINEVKERYFTAMAAEITRHGGKIEKYIGDAIMAVFGLPRAHEDDALRAVRAAHGMTQAMERLNRDLLAFYGVEIAARTGVNTGEVVANSDPNAEQRLATGDAVNVAARLEQAAPANEVLIGEVTYDLVRAWVDVEEVEPLELKGKAERVPAFKLLGVRDATELERQHTATDAPLVGRDAQLEQLRGSLREVASRGGARLATVLGEAGVGKSYLVDTFQNEVRSATTVLRGRCLPYGDGITFWPLVEVVRAAAGIVDGDSPETALERIGGTLEGVASAIEIRDRLASVAGLSSARFPVTEIFWGARKFLEALSARKPVVVCIEDVHNAEETFLDLLEHLLDTTAPQSAVFLVASGRLSLMEKRASWSGRQGVTLVPLPALEGADTERLVEVLLDGPVDPIVTSRVVASSEGNPLFVSQLVSMLVDKGLVHKHEDRWTASGDLATAAVPPTIQALLAARLDDLSREERAIMEPAAVIGLAFPQPAIEELVPEGLRPGVAAHLRALSRKQFLDRDVNTTSDDEIYRFRNLMIKDAVYGSLLKRARATMHERFVAWAERVNAESGRGEEFEEIHGYHLEQAYRYRTELGPIDAEGRSIAARAALKLGNAGRRAFARGDLPAAGSLMRRAIAVLQPDSTERVTLEIELGEVLREAGDFEDATTVFDRAIAAAETMGDDRLRARARLGRLGVALYAEEMEGGALARAVEEATASIQLFDAAGDHAGLANAYRIIGSIHATSGQYELAAEAAQRTVEHATAAGDRRLASRSAAGYATIARAGTIPAAEVVERCGPLLEQVQGDRKAEAVILAVIAVAEAMGARFDRARDLHLRARTILDELGRSVISASTSIEGSRIEMLAGDYARAEELLQADSNELEEIGERYFRSTVVGFLAHAQEAQGKT